MNGGPNLSSDAMIVVSGIKYHAPAMIQYFVMNV